MTTRAAPDRTPGRHVRLSTAPFVSEFHDELVARVQIIHVGADALGAVADAGLLARAAVALAAPSRTST